MNFDDVAFIRNHMEILVGAQWRTIGRAANLAWLGFLINDFEHALHIQSGFRVRTKDKVLTANLDMYDPTKTLLESPSFDWGSYDWDVQGDNCYDEWTGEFRKAAQKIIVQKVLVSDFGDLTIQLDNGMIIEVFINSSTDDSECWRFFKWKSSHKHLVVTGAGLEPDEE